ncbi:MAG: methylated-DNA--[protein]-cysteine S-methyltransferase [Paludibacterium sp.]|uniref:methylated-DNA--[protein]-cysteine S-methyltransferase n=1 Tax=Paludibacterium sp. TaxID=1917523 RepID=UPI0025EE97E0|nr:methylated-DNA--[protein]-cysteine S-methyltransferase [Paludibacterium sp.]MBV8045969.1 methylated-DNA--[protein]-cysteine S-methyltransferase [Paludibacterium sp.]MBV8649190.1 methylated-DNA--[protein]-cysteine S-methyltransferase [Paludibacterium sp.]
MHQPVVISAPFGCLGIETSGAALESIHFLPAGTPLSPPKPGSLAAEAAHQLDAWLIDPRFEFTLPLHIKGSDFQRRVWLRIAGIPMGQTLTYGDMARELGSVARAVGGACGRNPLPIIVPCHRVVAAAGLGGFNRSTGRQTLSIKEWLLAHERRR